MRELLKSKTPMRKYVMTIMSKYKNNNKIKYKNTVVSNKSSFSLCKMFFLMIVE